MTLSLEGCLLHPVLSLTRLQKPAEGDLLTGGLDSHHKAARRLRPQYFPDVTKSKHVSPAPEALRNPVWTCLSGLMLTTPWTAPDTGARPSCLGSHEHIELFWTLLLLHIVFSLPGKSFWSPLSVHSLVKTWVRYLLFEEALPKSLRADLFTPALGSSRILLEPPWQNRLLF